VAAITEGERFPLGPPQFDFAVIGDEDFELLCFLVVLMDFPDAERLRPPDDGADAGLEGAKAGSYRRCWQFKHSVDGHVSWGKCEASLDRAVDVYKMPHLAAAGCVIITVGGCTTLAVGAVAATIATSAYKNMRGSRKNYGRFGADVALGVASFGLGKVVGDVARSTFFVTNAGDRRALNGLTATGLFLTDVLLHEARDGSGGTDDGLGGNDK
jgi:hypothetical protein